MTILVGIDVAKDKHDCFFMNSEGEVLAKPFTIFNNKEGFDFLYEKIQSVSSSDNIKVGLEATGHYSYNIIGFLLNKGLATFILNPLHTNLYRKSLSLRKTKTDKIDSKTIAMMLLSDVSLKSYSDISYHNEDLKSLTRYRFSKVEERAKLKTSLSRLAQILFPELEKLVPTLHMTIYQLLEEFPSASAIASVHLTRLTNLLSKASKGHYDRETAIKIRDAAKNSIGSNMPTKSLELKHTIKLIRALTIDIGEIEAEISKMMDMIASPITTIPGIGRNIGAMIISEIGDFSRFSSPDKILAYAGFSPSIYQSDKLDNCYAHMEKRGSRYLRYALFHAAKLVCHWDKTFADYLAKKRAEGKHYYVAISHAVKKLVRVIFHIEKTKQAFLKAS